MTNLKKDEEFWRDVWQNLPTIIVLGKRYIKYFYIWLTQFPPFSLLTNLSWMNYQNREAYQTHCALDDTGYLAGIYFEVEQFYKDDNFVFFEGKFDRVIKRSSSKMFMQVLGRIYGEGNIYLSEMERGMKLIKITREAALNRKYYSFISER